ncbi:MAG: short-chain dehydrogenase/reductase [Ilumatobacteraceae bacterium]|nr:short-chain dehydrogenase/reductase [Ilumatobacteraceae bacterium]
MTDMTNEHAHTASTTPITVLITGGTRGLGKETARRLAGNGWTVVLGARDPADGERVAAELAGDVRVVAIDVTSDASVDAAARWIDEHVGHLDVLINNAGIAGGHLAVEDTGPADFLACFGVNVLGPVRTTRAFLPLLRRSSAPRIVNVSSGLGSHAVTTDPARLESSIHSIVYPSSKAALNMITTQYAKALPDIKVNVVDPGYTATDLNGHTGVQTITEGTDAIVAMASIGSDGPTGGFFDRHGRVPW